MATALKDPRFQLGDQRLFREHCYVDGAWIAAADGKVIKVTDPATGETVGTVPSVGLDETRAAIDAAERALPAWRAKTGKERGAILRRWFELVMANADDLAYLMTREQGKPLAEAKGEIGYGAVVPGMVRRGSQARLRRHHPADRGHAPHPGHQAAGRRLRRDHALELPERDDHAQGRPGAGRRLHHRGQARQRHAVLGAGDGRARRARRRARPACST